MKIMFLGGIFPRDELGQIFNDSIGLIQVAADYLQWNLIEGIETKLREPIDLISSRFVGYYPTLYKKICIKERRFSHVEGASDFAIGFINLKGIEIYHRMAKLYRPVHQWISQNRDQDKLIVFVYSAQPQFLKTIEKIKRKNKEVHVCLIVPDLPEYMKVSVKKTLARYIYDTFMEKRLNRIVYDNLKSVDSFVVLTEKMKEPLKIGEKPYAVVEGIVNTENFIENELTEESVPLPVVDILRDKQLKTILYSGTLAQKYGIMDLVEAFHIIKSQNLRLIICGDGDSKDAINEYSQKDSRILLLGAIEHKQVRFLQSRATILVNPRKNDHEYTKYSFPSKTMEYMQSGRPVLMHKLDGIPNEYDEYLYYFETFKNKNMGSVIEMLLMEDEKTLHERGEKAKSFVVNNKNKEKQAEKILRMIGIDFL